MHLRGAPHPARTATLSGRYAGGRAPAHAAPRASEERTVSNAPPGIVDSGHVRGLKSAPGARPAPRTRQCLMARRPEDVVAVAVTLGGRGQRTRLRVWARGVLCVRQVWRLRPLCVSCRGWAIRSCLWSSSPRTIRSGHGGSGAGCSARRSSRGAMARGMAGRHGPAVRRSGSTRVVAGPATRSRCPTSRSQISPQRSIRYARSGGRSSITEPGGRSARTPRAARSASPPADRRRRRPWVPVRRGRPRPGPRAPARVAGWSQSAAARAAPAAARIARARSW